MSSKARAKDTTGTKSSLSYGFQQIVSVEENNLKMFIVLKVSTEKKAVWISSYLVKLYFITKRDSNFKLPLVILDKKAQRYTKGYLKYLGVAKVFCTKLFVFLPGVRSPFFHTIKK